MNKTRGDKKRYWLNLLRAFFIPLFSAVLILFYVVYPVYVGDRRLHPPRSSSCCQTPADFGMDFEDISLKTRDGLTLKGWYIPSFNRAAIILAHGAGGNRGSHLDMASELNRIGFGVLLIELRNHGDSEGSVISFSGEDVLAGIQYLSRKPEIAQKKIGVWGCSLGAMVAIQSAALTDDVQAVIADGPGPAGLLDEPPPQTLYDALVLPAYMVEYVVWWVEGAMSPLPITRALGEFHSRPVLLIAGNELAFEVQTVQNYYRQAPGPKEIWLVPGAGHCGGWQVQKDAYLQKMKTFFEAALLSPQ